MPQVSSKIPARSVKAEKTNASNKPPSYRKQDQETGEQDKSDHESEVAEELSASDHDEDKPIVITKKRETKRSTTKQVKETKTTELKVPVSFLLLRFAQTQGHEEVTFTDHNTFVPSPFMLFEVLHSMHQSCANNTYLFRTFNLYNPILSRLYYGVMFMISILRASRAANNLSSSMRRQLSAFEDSYPMESLPIAGPLVQYFDSIAAYKPAGERYNYVHPTFPTMTSLTAKNEYNTNDLRTIKLPAIRQLLASVKILQSTKRSDTEPKGYVDDADIWYPGHIQAATSPMTSFAGVTIHSTAVTDAQHIFLNQAGMNHPLESEFENLLTFAKKIKSSKFPAIDAADDISNPFKFAYLKDDSSWFAICVAAATAESSFFLGGSNFSQTNVTTGPSLVVRSDASALKLPATITKNFYTHTVYQPPATFTSHSESASPDDITIGQFNQLQLTLAPNAIGQAKSVASTRPQQLATGSTAPIYIGDRPAYYEHEFARHENTKSVNVTNGITTTIRTQVLVPKGIETRAK